MVGVLFSMLGLTKPWGFGFKSLYLGKSPRVGLRQEEFGTFEFQLRGGFGWVGGSQQIESSDRGSWEGGHGGLRGPRKP